MYHNSSPLFLTTFTFSITFLDKKLNNGNSRLVELSGLIFLQILMIYHKLILLFLFVFAIINKYIGIKINQGILIEFVSLFIFFFINPLCLSYIYKWNMVEYISIKV